MFRGRVKNKQFDFIPKFYDPVKEDLEARMAVHNEEKKDVDHLKHNIRSGFQRKARGNTSLSSSIRKKSNMRLLMIIGILALLSYMMLQSDLFIKFAETISG